jgi:hypothetical protein
MRRLALVGGAVLVVMTTAVAVGAQTLDGGCAVEATSDLDQTTMIDATRSDPFEIDPEGTISWIATSPGAIMDHTWVINVDIGGFGVPVASGGDPNTAGTLDSEGTRSIPELVEEAEEAGVPSASLLGSLRGIYRVFGEIDGTSSCAGDGYVLIKGNPLQETVGQVAAALALIGLLMVLRAGVKKTG